MAWSFAKASNAAIDGNIFGVLFHSKGVADGLQKKTNSLLGKDKLENQKKGLVLQLRAGRSRLQKGKKGMAFHIGGTIKATVPELVALENRVWGANSSSELANLRQEVDRALGFK
jgi:hypothetical protein